jgi:phage terminase large subunit-like protein
VAHDPPTGDPPTPRAKAMDESPNIRKTSKPKNSESTSELPFDLDLAQLPAPLRDMIRNGSLDELKAIQARVQTAVSTKKLETFTPFPKQIEFITAGATNKTRLLLAGNRAGKSETAAYEAAVHLTGKYPPDWTGKKFDKPIIAWVAGVSAQATRNILQSKLIGPPNRRAEWGTGFLPKADLDLDNVSMQPGIPNAIDSISVRHVSGGYSTLSFLAFSMGREKFQGTEVGLVLLDEECPLEVFSECLTRTATTKGIVMLTFTPLTGVTPLVQLFLDPQTRPGALIRATIDDNLSIDRADIEEIVASWPAHERDARRLGVPFMGSGKIFDVNEETIRCEPFAIPAHYRQVIGIDLGFDHPWAAVRLAHDADADIIYITHATRMKGSTVLMQAEHLKGWGGAVIPTAWPHDALQHDRSSGETFANLYRQHGINMLHERAQFEDGSNSVERGIQEMRDRMMTGRLKVFSSLGEWFDEFRLYHRKNGQIVKMGDDLLSATRYALMMLRYAQEKGSSAYGTKGALKRGIRVV